MYSWSDQYNIGEETIDKQHKMFMQYINDLEAAGINAGTYNDVSAMIIFLQDYSAKHFSYEESYMTKVNYPYLERHRAIHQSFTTQVEAFYQRLRLKDSLSLLALDISQTMGDWLIEHIQNVDGAITTYIKTGRLIEI